LWRRGSFDSDALFAAMIVIAVVAPIAECLLTCSKTGC
jgi:hypothetical protein